MSAVSVSPTCAVPVMVGAPVAGLFCAVTVAAVRVRQRPARFGAYRACRTAVRRRRKCYDHIRWGGPGAPRSSSAGSPPSPRGPPLLRSRSPPGTPRPEVSCGPCLTREVLAEAQHETEQATPVMVGGDTLEACRQRWRRHGVSVAALVRVSSLPCVVGEGHSHLDSLALRQQRPGCTTNS